MVEDQRQVGAPVFPRTGAAYSIPRKTGDGGKTWASSVQTIASQPREIYALSTRVELLPSWQEGVISVTQAAGDRLHWKTEDPGTGKVFEFDTETLESVPGRRHVTRIVDGPLAGSTDTVTFDEHPTGRGTVVRWVREVHAPGDFLTKVVSAVVSRTPDMIVAENLRHLKAMVEGGEIPSVEGQPAGPRGAVGWLKQFALGETMHTPAGTSDRARPQDLPKRGLAQTLNDPRAVVLGSVVAMLVGGALAAAAVRKVTR